MKRKNPAAVALGSIRSPRKGASSRENGKLGGRPRNCPKCKGRATKLLSISTGLMTCQQCGHRWQN